MREILFRGRRKDTGEWEFGFPFVGKKASYILDAKMSSGSDTMFMEFDGVEVIPETAGQYTGLEDKHGKRIFEGDIVRVRVINDVGLCVVTFEHGAFFLQCIDGGILDETLWDAWYSDAGIETIGNIHDTTASLKECK